MKNKSKLETLDLFDGHTNASQIASVNEAVVNALTCILNKHQVEDKDAEVLMNAVDTGFLKSHKDFQSKPLYWVSVIGLSLRNGGDPLSEAGEKFSWKKINRKLADHDGVFSKSDSITDFVVLNELRKVAIDLNKATQFDDLALTAVKLSLLAEGSADYAKAWIKGLTDEDSLKELSDHSVSPTPVHPVSLYLSTEGETYFPNREKLLADRGDSWAKDALSIASVVKNWSYHEDPLLVADEDGKRHVGKEPWFQWLRTVDAEVMSPELSKYPEFIEDANELMDLEPATQRVLKALVASSFTKGRTNDESVLEEALQAVEQAEKEEKTTTHTTTKKKSSFNF